MADQITYNPLRALDTDSSPVSGALAYFYESGTSTPLTVYTDSGLGTPHASPQVADSSGVFAPAFVANGTAVKVDVKDPDTAVSLPGFPLDPCYLIRSADSTAASVSFAPTSDILSTTVQAAIEEVQANIDEAIANLTTPTLTGGTSSAFTLTPGTTLTAYADGVMVAARFHTATSASATLNVDSLGAKALKYYRQAGTLNAVPNGGIQAYTTAILYYNASNDAFIVLAGMNTVPDQSSGYVKLLTDGTMADNSTSHGVTQSAVVTYVAGRRVIGTETATTSGTSHDYTVASGAKQIVVGFIGVSTNGTSRPIVQLGTSSTPTTSGYTWAAGDDGSTNTTVTSGIGITRAAPTAGSVHTGSMTLNHLGSNKWVASGTVFDGTNANHFTGYIALAGACDILRITTVNGTDTFDAGSVNVRIDT